MFRFDAAFEQVHPCIGCDRCGRGKAPCVFEDGMSRLYPKLIEADVVAYITPLYYHHYSAQLKAVVDRFHGVDELLVGTGKKSVLIVTAADRREWATDGVVAAYRTDMRYLQWESLGVLLARGCYHAEDILKTDYPSQAYALGRSL